MKGVYPFVAPLALCRMDEHDGWIVHLLFYSHIGLLNVIEWQNISPSDI